ncbi:MAG TPA: DUF4124 domain-containing protein [Candidatus Binatia bacterium]
MRTRIPLVATTLVLCLCTLPARAEIYRWTDESGRTHFDDDKSRVPDAQRDHAQVYQAKARPEPPGPPSTGPTQSMYAAALARELGLQVSPSQDPVSLLHLVGIYPSMGWYPNAPLSPAVVQEVVTATRTAGRARRLGQSEAGAEATAIRVASSLGVAAPPPQAEPEPPPPPPVVVAPNIVVQAPPPTVIVEHVQPPQVVLSDYPTFAFGIPFAPLPFNPNAPIPDRIVPLSNPAGRLHGPLVPPLVSRGFQRPVGP